MLSEYATMTRKEAAGGKWHTTVDRCIGSAWDPLPCISIGVLDTPCSKVENIEKKRRCTVCFRTMEMKFYEYLLSWSVYMSQVWSHKYRVMLLRSRQACQCIYSMHATFSYTAHPFHSGCSLLSYSQHRADELACICSGLQLIDSHLIF